MHVEKNGSDEISGGNHIGSDTFQNGSDTIRYPTVILSPVNISPPKLYPLQSKPSPSYPFSVNSL